jgi:hypothetical protein
MKTYQGCIKSQNYVQLLLDFLLSSAFGVLIIASLYSSGLQKYLFFNETSSNKETCSMPKKQTFKCAVYKNGELIG